MKGFLLAIIMDEEMFMLEFFKFLRIGVSWVNDDMGKATCFIFGLWKLESNFTLIYRKSLDWHEIGQA
tara:strand:- start:17 stop:220 length:204 start_codon:yes stop_codon:yes gene_type:complete